MQTPSLTKLVSSLPAVAKPRARSRTEGAGPEPLAAVLGLSEFCRKLNMCIVSPPPAKNQPQFIKRGLHWVWWGIITFGVEQTGVG